MGGGNVKGQGEVQTKHVGSRQGNICPSVSREVPVNSYCPSFVNDIISFQFQKRSLPGWKLTWLPQLQTFTGRCDHLRPGVRIRLLEKGGPKLAFEKWSRKG